MPDKIQTVSAEKPNLEQEGNISDEKKIEQEQAVEKEPKEENTEQVEQKIEINGEQLKNRPISITKKPTSIPQVRDEMTLEIEKILEEGVAEEFEKLSPVAKQEFKIKGEQAAIQIRELMNATKIKVKKILKIIFEWLRIMPGVNRFFLEQEAKIKTDRIIHLKEDQ